MDAIRLPYRGGRSSISGGQCVSTEDLDSKRKSIFKQRLITHYEKLQSLMISVAYQNVFFFFQMNKKRKSAGWGSPFTTIIVFIIWGSSVERSACKMLFRVSDSQKPLALLQNAAATTTETTERTEKGWGGRLGNNNDFVHSKNKNL